MTGRHRRRIMQVRVNGPGPEGTPGPISKAWNVRGWPTIYVLDHEGVIRYKGLREKRLNEVVDQLLAEREKEGAGGE